MSWIDVVIVLLVVLFAYQGWVRGFLFVLVDLIGIVISLIVALLLYSYAAAPFRAPDRQAGLVNVIAFILIFIVMSFVYWLAASRLLRALPARARRSSVNRALGVLLGAAKGVVIAALLVLLLVALPIGVTREAVERSAIAAPMLRLGTSIERFVTSVVPEDIREGLAFVTIPPETDRSVSIPSTTNINLDPEAERRMLALVNRERTQRDLQPLRMDSELRAVAREHSADMFQRGYFSHINPDGENPFDRMRDADVTFRTAGENLAMAPTVEIAHNGLMNSPGHRANILNPAYRNAGIGVYSSPRQGRMYTQLFRN